MEIECIFYLKNGTEEEYDLLAYEIEQKNANLFPLSLAMVKEPAICTTYYGCGSFFQLVPGMLVLFAAGSLQQITNFTAAQPLFPKEKQKSWYEDLKFYN